MAGQCSALFTQIRNFLPSGSGPSYQESTKLLAIAVNLHWRDGTEFRYTRLAEHGCSVGIRNFKTSVVAEHALSSEIQLGIILCSTRWKLTREKNFESRMLVEAIEIGRHPSFNSDKGWDLPSIWKCVLLNATRNKKVDAGDYVKNIVSAYCASLNSKWYR